MEDEPRNRDLLSYSLRWFGGFDSRVFSSGNSVNEMYRYKD